MTEYTVTNKADNVEVLMPAAFVRGIYELLLQIEVDDVPFTIQPDSDIAEAITTIISQLNAGMADRGIHPDQLHVSGLPATGNAIEDEGKAMNNKQPLYADNDRPMYEWRITYQANKDEPVETAELGAYDEDHLLSEAMDEFGSPYPRDLVVIKIEKLGLSE